MVCVEVGLKSCFVYVSCHTLDDGVQLKQSSLCVVFLVAVAHENRLLKEFALIKMENNIIILLTLYPGWWLILLLAGWVEGACVLCVG